MLVISTTRLECHKLTKLSTGIWYFRWRNRIPGLINKTSVQAGFRVLDGETSFHQLKIDSFDNKTPMILTSLWLYLFMYAKT